MSCKQSILSFFPKSTLFSGGKTEKYMVMVISQRNDVLLAARGKTAKQAWCKAYKQIYEILKPFLSRTAAITFLTSANQGE